MTERKQDSSSTDEGDRARAINLAWARVREARTYYSKTLHVRDALERWTTHYPDFMGKQELYDAVEKMHNLFRDEYWRAEEMVSEAFRDIEGLENER